MSYTPPAGNAANFTATGYSPAPSTAVGFRFPSALYSAPGPSSALFQLPAEYVAPSGSTVYFNVAPATEFIGSGVIMVDITVSGAGEYHEYNVVGQGATTVDLVALGVGSIGVTGNGAVVVAAPVAAGVGVRGVAGQGTVSFSGFSAAGTGVVERYELKGEVRQAGVLINRRVRAYHRDTGALVNEGDTVAGRFRLHTGFAPAEYYVIPIDLSNDAADWTPPCANRLVSVLAMDA